MKHKQRPVIHLRTQLWWACKLGEVESLGISKATQTVLAWYQSPGPLGGGPRKGTMASACLDARHLSLPLHAPGAPQTFTLAPEPRESESEWVSPCVGSLRGTAWDSRGFFHWLNSHWFLLSEVVGNHLLCTGTLGWGSCCGPVAPCSQDIPPKFLSTTCEWGTSSASGPLLPVWMDVVSLIL